MVGIGAAPPGGDSEPCRAGAGALPAPTSLRRSYPVSRPRLSLREPRASRLGHLDHRGQEGPDCRGGPVCLECQGAPGTGWESCCRPAGSSRPPGPGAAGQGGASWRWHWEPERRGPLGVCGPGRTGVGPRILGPALPSTPGQPSGFPPHCHFSVAEQPRGHKEIGCP